MRISTLFCLLSSKNSIQLLKKYIPSTSVELEHNILSLFYTTFAFLLFPFFCFCVNNLTVAAGNFQLRRFSCLFIYLFICEKHAAMFINLTISQDKCSANQNLHNSHASNGPLQNLPPFQLVLLKYQNIQEVYVGFSLQPPFKVSVAS